VFHDATLQEMCLRLPQTMEEFSELSGVGERKLERYGPAFVGVINQHLAA
jgi:ATP-dependent DNA helicase RecQ